MKRYIIQEEISVDEEFVKRVIEHYSKMKSSFYISFGDFSGDKFAIIEEIKKLSDVGKSILMMTYNFEHSEFYKENIKEKK